MRTRFLPLFLGIAVAFAALVASTPASAQAVCTGGTITGTAVTAPPIDAVFEVEGKITDICEETDQVANPIQGTITVNGLTINVPLGLNADVGDVACAAVPAQETPFGTLDGVDASLSPSVFSLVGGTGIISGAITVPAAGVVTHTATCVFVEEAENGLVSVRLDGGDPPDANVMDMGNTVVVMEQDPRFVDFNVLIDDAGQVLTDFADIPAGTLVGAEGVFVFDAARCTALGAPSDPCFSARVVEAALIADLGFEGFVEIARAQCKDRPDRREMRVRGSATPTTAIVTIVEHNANGDHLGVVVSNIAVGADNSWEFRGAPETGSCPAIIEAHTDLGAESGMVDVVISN